MFEIANQWIIALLPLPLIIWALIPSAKPRQTAALRIPFYQQIQDLQSQASHQSHQFKFSLWVLFLVWCLLVFAASGPRWVGKAVELPRSGRDVMLAIDISGSMNTPDMMLYNKRVNRLQAIKSIAGQFIADRQGDRVGLILFGTKAYLQAPLSFDRNTVNVLLDDATIGLAGPQTAIGDAIGMAIKRLKKYPKDDRILVLLTDGANNAGNVTPLSAAKMAAKYNVKIYTIGFGADRAVVQSMLGPQVINPSSDLDENALRQIASLTGGQYFRAKDTKGLQQIYDHLNKIEPAAKDHELFRPIEPLYQWPLGAAFVLSVLLLCWPVLRRRSYST